MKEYKLDVSVKILLYFFVIFLVGVALYLVYDAKQNQILIFPSILCACGAIFCIVIAVNWKLTIYEDAITYRQFFKEKRIYFFQIAGFRIQTRAIIIEPNDWQLDELKIYTDGLDKDKKEIINWLNENFKNLDEIERKNGEEEILQNDLFGNTEEERAERLREATKYTSISATAGIVIMFWGLIWPEPLDLVLMTGALFPIVPLFLYRRYNGLIKLTSDTNSVYPDISAAILCPAIMLLTQSALDFHLLDYKPIWIWTFVIGLIATAVFFLDPKKVYKYESGQNLAASVVIVSLIYGFGLSGFINSYFDTSAGKQYRKEVISKRISSRRHNYYYVKLGPWGDKDYDNSVEVDEDLYKTVNVDDSVLITLHPGKLGAAWFTVSK